MVLLVFAILLLILGHVFKSLRWRQLLHTYEDVNHLELLKAISIGQAINMIIPYRIGDIYRVWKIGKNLDNGFVLSTATGIIDIFIDIVIVGLSFAALFILKIHRDIVSELAIQYSILSFVVIGISVIFIVTRKYVKYIILKIASIFNANIETKLLMTSYTLLTGIKDVLKGKNIIRVSGYTALIWICYFISYGFFAEFLQKLGYDVTLTGVFSTIFSMSGKALLLQCISLEGDITWLSWFSLYLLIPLVVILFWVNCSSYTTHKSRRILPQLNEAERRAFLDIYFSGNQQQYFDYYLDINKDIAILRDCSAGSNAATVLGMDDRGGTFYRKYTFGKETEKLADQIRWLKKHEYILPLCTILRDYCDTRICYYDMEHKNNPKSYFEYIHIFPLEKSWGILSQAIDILNKQLYLPSLHENNQEKIKEYIEEKILNNIIICEKWCEEYYKELLENEVVIVNGNGYYTLGHYKNMFSKEKLMEIFKDDPCADIHGDLTIENIVCTDDSWYIIDPNPGNLHETPYLDYSKILQSLHGKYEFATMVKDVKVFENHVEFVFSGSMAYKVLYDKYKQWLFEHFNLKKLRSIYYHEIAHWLRLLPYKIRKNPQSAVVFYVCMLMVLKDVEEMFPEVREV